MTRAGSILPCCSAGFFNECLIWGGTLNASGCLIAMWIEDMVGSPRKLSESERNTNGLHITNALAMLEITSNSATNGEKVKRSTEYLGRSMLATLTRRVLCFAFQTVQRMDRAHGGLRRVRIRRIVVPRKNGCGTLEIFLQLNHSSKS